MSAETAPRFVHEALFFRSTQELVDEAARFLREGLATGADAVLLCAESNNIAVARALGADERIICLSQQEIFQKPVTAIASIRDFVRSRLESGSDQIRMVGEVDFGDSRGLWDEWNRFEALLNHVLSPFPVWCLCGYDTTALPDPVVTGGETTHPYLRRAGVRGASPAYVEPAEILHRAQTRLDPLPAAAPAMTVTDLHDLRALSRWIRESLGTAGVAAETADDLVLAANEIATNGLRHGAPPVDVQLWVTPARITCTVTDRGSGIDDPFAGYLPGGGQTLPEGHFGLWLARRLCDHLELLPTAEGFTVRLAMER